MNRAGDFDYERAGGSYSRIRRGDPHIERMVHDALGDARTVINVGAGSGSYEPTDRIVVAVEPSASMRSQRPIDRVPAIDATAELLPFDDDAFEAAMATVTVHQWSDASAGLRELRRVTTGPIVILTFDGDALDRFWLADYAPELIAAERNRYQPLAWFGSQLGGITTITPVPIPIDCTDGFTEAFYARPERLLDDAVRRSQSAWGFVDAAVERRFVEQLSADLDDGTWHRRYGHLLDAPTFDGSLRLIVNGPSHDAT
ncbi:MAG: methyltransferase domain-containing protein [Acidimicrobiia bacterium]